MKFLSFILLLWLSLFNNKSSAIAKPSFTTTLRFRTQKAVPGFISYASAKSVKMKYKFKKDENLDSYHNIKLQSIHINGADMDSFPTHFRSVKIFISSPSKKELEISSNPLKNESMHDYVLNIDDTKVLDTYLKDPELEYNIEYILDASYREFNFRVDFEFIGEPVNK